MRIRYSLQNVVLPVLICVRKPFSYSGGYQLVPLDSAIRVASNTATTPYEKPINDGLS